MTEERDESLDKMALVSEIVAAYVSNNTMEASEIPEFIKLVYRNLYNKGTGKSLLRIPSITEGKLC